MALLKPFCYLLVGASVDLGGVDWGKASRQLILDLERHRLRNGDEFNSEGAMLNLFLDRTRVSVARGWKEWVDKEATNEKTQEQHMDLISLSEV